jgi:hypothetical protein
VVPYPLPQLPRGFENVVRVIMGGAPAVLLVLVGVLILLLGLFLEPGRQRYALRAATSAFDTARALVGSPADRNRT